MSNPINNGRSFTSQNTKLSPRSSPNNFLPLNSLPIHHPRNLDIIIRPLSCAIPIAKTPTISFSIPSHGDRVIRPCGTSHGIQFRDLCRLSQDLGIIPRVADHMFIGEGVEFVPCLIAVDAAPGETFTVMGDGNAVELAAVYAGNLALVSEAGDWFGVEDDGFIAAGAFCDAGLAVVIEAPGVNFAVFVDGEGVGVASGDVGHRFWESKFTRDKAIEFGALDYSAAQLVLLASAPGEDGTIGAEGEDVVGACSYFCDFFQTLKKDWASLDLC